jgi:copper chaperone CopZ
MAGPATNVATIGAAYRVFGTRIMTVYLCTVFVGSIGFGLLFDVFWALEASNMTMDHGHDSLLVTGSAVVLTALLLWYGIQDLHQLIRPKGPSGGQETVALTVSGMTCGGCVKTLTSSLQSVDGVERVDVVLDTGRAEVYGIRLDRDALEHAVHKVGFSL